MGWLQRLKLVDSSAARTRPRPFCDAIGGGPCHGLAVGDPGTSAPLDFAQNALRAKSRDLVWRTAWAAAGSLYQSKAAVAVARPVLAAGRPYQYHNRQMPGGLMRTHSALTPYSVTCSRLVRNVASSSCTDADYNRQSGPGGQRRVRDWHCRSGRPQR